MTKYPSSSDHVPPSVSWRLNFTKLLENLLQTAYHYAVLIILWH